MRTSELDAEIASYGHSANSEGLREENAEAS